MLWELLAGKRPFEDGHANGNWTEILTGMLQRRQAGVTPEMLAQLPADCPPGLKDVLLECLPLFATSVMPTRQNWRRELESAVGLGAGAVATPAMHSQTSSAAMA